jgi:hypothetical protein
MPPYFTKVTPVIVVDYIIPPKIINPSPFARHPVVVRRERQQRRRSSLYLPLPHSHPHPHPLLLSLSLLFVSFLPLPILFFPPLPCARPLPLYCCLPLRVTFRSRFFTEGDLISHWRPTPTPSLRSFPAREIASSPSPQPPSTTRRGRPHRIFNLALAGPRSKSSP